MKPPLAAGSAGAALVNRLAGRFVNRVGDRLPRRLRRFAAGSRMADDIQLERRLQALSEAVAENARLEVSLERRVAAVERSLVPALRARQRQLRRRARPGSDGELR